MRTYATMLATPPGLLHPFRRQHLCRLSDPARAEAAERRNLEEHRHRGEIPGRADARRLSRQLQIQSARPEPARVQRRGADASRNGTITRSPTTGGRARRCSGATMRTRARSLLAARGRRAFHEFMPMRETLAETGRIYRKIAYGPLLDVFLLDMRSYRGPNIAAGPRLRAAARHPRAGADRLAQARAGELEGDLEGHRRRSADRPDQRRRDRAGRRPAARPRARDRRPARPSSSTPASAIRSGSPPTCITRPRTTTTRTAPCSRTSSRSGSSSPVRSMPAPGDRASSTTRSARRAMYQNGCSDEQGENLAPCFGLQFFGHVAIDGAHRGDDGDAQGRRATATSGRRASSRGSGPLVGARPARAFGDYESAILRHPSMGSAHMTGHRRWPT